MNEKISELTGAFVAILIFILLVLFVMFIIQLCRKKNWKKLLVFVGIDFSLVIILTFIGSFSYSKTDNYKTRLEQNEKEKNKEKSKLEKEKKQEKIEGTEQKKIEDGDKERKNQKKLEEGETKEANEKEETPPPFPNTEKYIVNNVLLKYNEIAECSIDNEYIEHIIRVERPLEKTTYTLSNGVYFIIQYNDYSRILFVDYQEEASDDYSLYTVMRDMMKSVNSDIKNEEIEIMWSELKTNKYSSYYGGKYLLGGFEISYSTRKLNDGKIRYSIKTEYRL